MKRLCLLFVYLFCVRGLLVSEAQSSDQVPAAPAQISSGNQLRLMRLTTSIRGQKYCRADEELDVLQFDLRLKFSNVGNQNIILYKYSDQASRVMVSRSPQDAAAVRFEINASFTLVTAPAPKNFKRPPFSRLFVILPPGASYQTRTKIGVLLVRGDAKPITGTVAAGEHVLLIEVPTWTGTQRANELRHRWARRGFLWSEPLISEPMPFKVEKERTVVDCS